MPPILGRAQDESSRPLHHSSACLKRDAADGHWNRDLEPSQDRWVVLVDHLLDVTPQGEIWGCQAGGLGDQPNGTPKLSLNTCPMVITIVGLPFKIIFEI